MKIKVYHKYSIIHVYNYVFIYISINFHNVY